MSLQKIHDYIELSREIRDNYQSLVSFDMKDYPRLGFDLSVITLNLGRQKGHSTYIQRHAVGDDVVVLFNFVIMNRTIMSFQRGLRIYIGTNVDLWRENNDIFTQAKNIWIDDYSAYPQDKKERMTQAYLPIYLNRRHQDQNIIQLG